MGVCGAAPKILELSDGLYFATYHWSFDIHAEKREDAIRPEFLELSVFVFRSTDGARTWECISQIAPDEDIVRSGSGFEGLDEPQMDRLNLRLLYSTLDICLFLLDDQGKSKRSILNCQYCTIILCVKDYSFAKMM